MIKLWGCMTWVRQEGSGSGPAPARRLGLLSPEYQERKLAASGPRAGGRAAYKVNTRKTKRRCHAG